MLRRVPFLLLGSLFFGLSGCDVPGLMVPPNGPEAGDAYPVVTDSMRYVLELSGDAYESEHPIAYTYTNPGADTVYIPVRFGATPPPTFQKAVGGAWREAIASLVLTGGYNWLYEGHVAVAPGETYRDEEAGLWFGADQLLVDEAPGTYRVVLTIYADSSFLFLLPPARRASNPFELDVGARSTRPDRACPHSSLKPRRPSWRPHA